MIRRMCWSCLFLIANALLLSVFADGVYLTGTIKDSLTHQGLQNATVSLASTPSVSSVTGDDGYFALVGSTTGALKGASLKNLNFVEPRVMNNNLYFSVNNNGIKVRIDFYSTAGRRVATLLDKNLNRGIYRADLSAARLVNQFYYAKVQIGSEISIVKYIYCAKNVVSSMHSPIATGRGEKTLAKVNDEAVVDTLIVIASGHKTLRAPIASYSGTLSFAIVADRLQGLAHITSVSPLGLNTQALGKRTAEAFVEPTINPGFINSGAPDYLTVRLKQIRVVNNDSIIDTTSHSVFSKVVWKGEKTLKLTGSGNVDVGDIVLDSFPTCKITGIELSFNDSAIIKGKVEGTFNKDTSNSQFLGESKTFFTKYTYGYNAESNTGGADASVGRYAAFDSGPAESTSICLQGSANGEAMTITPTNYTFDTAGPAPSLTILVDLSRVLRFYNGCNLSHSGGVNGNDPANKAYFFCHSVFGASIAAFFGTPGQIQGYASVYNCTNGNCGVKAWMTIICNPAGQIISGILIGNDDNDFTIAKGYITTVTGTNPIDFHYALSNVDITGFSKGSALKDSTIVAWHQLATEGGNPERTGHAKFTLEFKTN
jgi:hypothetical protein